MVLTAIPYLYPDGSSDVVRLEARVFGQTSKHPRTEFFALVEGENKVGPSWS
jgi:hypothetical protein